jgi:hypothetical protein
MITLTLRLALYKLLGNIIYNNTPLKIYYKYVPKGVDVEEYVIIHNIQYSQDDNKNIGGYKGSFIINVFSVKELSNNGYNLDKICEAILTELKPTITSVLDLSADNMQMTSLDLSNDETFESIYGENSQLVVLQRSINFDFKITKF